MSNFSRFIPAHIWRLVEAGQSKPLQQPPSGSKPVLLNLNENPFGPSPLAIKALQSALSDIHRYPEIHATDLHRQIAKFHNVTPEQVLVTAGATELLGMISRALLRPGLNAITSAKSFIVYKLATQLTEGRLIEVPTANRGYDLGAVTNAIDRDTRIVFIANPNNPTGSLLSSDEIDRFVSQLPDHVLLVLDEAYGDFAEYFVRSRGQCGADALAQRTETMVSEVSDQSGAGAPAPHTNYSRSLEYVKQDRNVIVLKTFSKTHGLAGLRVGYGIGPMRLLSLFAPLRTIFSVSLLAQAAAAAALHDSEHIRRVVESNADQTELVSNSLRELGFRIPQTWANFLYVEVEGHASAFADRLREHGIVVQPLESWGAPNAIRVSIGTPEENQQFLIAIKAMRG